MVRDALAMPEDGFYSGREGAPFKTKVSMACDAILDRHRSLANPENVAGMARYGINPKGTAEEGQG